MSSDIEVDVRDGIVRVRAVGDLDETMVVRVAEATRDACDDAGLDRALVDAAGLVNRLSVGEIYYLVQRFTSIVGRGRRVAYIGSPLSPPDDRFTRTVASTRGWMLESFEHERDALDWLEREESID